MPAFVPGLELSRLLYEEAVKPILGAHFKGLAYSAALIGPGSEVLGFDTPMSTDHSWGPRLQLFISESEYDSYRDRIAETLANELPYEFRGYPTSFGDPDRQGTRMLERVDRGPVRHLVEVHTIRGYFQRSLRVNPYEEITAREWLTFSEQMLLSITAGAVYHDGLGEVHGVRAKFRYYPHDVWLYLLAAQWRRIEQEGAFVGRCGDVGDELGSSIIAARLVHDVMRLCFLMERRYPPYSKWFGSAFKQLTCAKTLLPILESVLRAPDWHTREHNLSRAYEHVARMHNDLGITEPIEAKVSRFHNRPYLVLFEECSEAIRRVIQDEKVLALTPHIGSVDQFSDSTDILSYPEQRERLRAVY